MHRHQLYHNQTWEWTTTISHGCNMHSGTITRHPGRSQPLRSVLWYRPRLADRPGDTVMIISWLKMRVSSNRGTPPIINFDGICHYMNHPLWGTPIDGTPLNPLFQRGKLHWGYSSCSVPVQTRPPQVPGEGPLPGEGGRGDEPRLLDTSWKIRVFPCPKSSPKIPTELSFPKLACWRGYAQIFQPKIFQPKFLVFFWPGKTLQRRLPASAMLDAATGCLAMADLSKTISKKWFHIRRLASTGFIQVCVYIYICIYIYLFIFIFIFIHITTSYKEGMMSTVESLSVARMLHLPMGKAIVQGGNL